MLALVLTATLAVVEMHIIRQGDTKILRLTEEQCAGDLTVFGRSHQCSEGNRLILGVDLETEPGAYAIGTSGMRVDVIRRVSGRLRKRGPGRRIDPVKRAQEIQLMVEAFASGPVKYPNWPAGVEFREPLTYVNQERFVTDPFGFRRYYRRTPKDALAVPHKGVDLRARYGTPVLAASYGAVVLAHTFSEGSEGNMVVLYHGDGIYSLYLHLGHFNCIPGQIVRGGDVIAYSGESGVAGQPHLHFAIKVNGSNVEPLEFIPLFNAYLAEIAKE